MKPAKITAEKPKGAIKYALYTFIMYYLGGTYISQVTVASEEKAIRIWIRNLKISEIKGFGEADKKNINRE